MEVTACGVGGRDSLPDVGVGGGRQSRVAVVVGWPAVLANTTCQKDGKLSKSGFGVA